MKRMKTTLDIPGDYQYRARFFGHPVQRFWHSLKPGYIEKNCPLSPGMRALDIGCGSGVTAYHLAGLGLQIDAIDANPESISFAQKNFKRGNLRFQMSRIDQMNFGPASFDLIYCLEVIEHITNPEIDDLLSRVFSLLKINGYFILTTPNYASLWPLLEFFADLFSRVPPMRNEQHVTMFTKKKLLAVLRARGFTSIRCTSDCGVSPFFAGISWKLAEWVQAVERKLNNPLGNILIAVCRK
jgi:2-polyprenyl-3-methyl-5-hydroxy-6-metoxy-1,4-benzoquinol methylase